MSTFAPAIGHLQRTVTEASAAANTDYSPYASEFAYLAAVPQIPEDVHRMFSIFGDEQADEKLTDDQKRRFRAQIEAAKETLRDIYIAQQRERLTWIDKEGNRIWSGNFAEPEQDDADTDEPVYRRRRAHGRHKRHRSPRVA